MASHTRHLKLFRQMLAVKKDGINFAFEKLIGREVRNKTMSRGMKHYSERIDEQKYYLCAYP